MAGRPLVGRYRTSIAHRPSDRSRPRPFHPTSAGGRFPPTLVSMYAAQVTAPRVTTTPHHKIAKNARIATGCPLAFKQIPPAAREALCNRLHRLHGKSPSSVALQPHTPVSERVQWCAARASIVPTGHASLAYAAHKARHSLHQLCGNPARVTPVT